MGLKRGSLNLTEKDFILKNAATMPPAEIAKILERSEEVVKKFVKSSIVPSEPWEDLSPEQRANVHRVLIKQELRDTEEWKRLKQEFDADDQKLFEEKYIELMTQFQQDILPSEETQVLQVVKLQVLQSNNLITRKKYHVEATRLEAMIDDFLRPYAGDYTQLDDIRRSQYLELARQLQISRDMERALTPEYNSLLDRVNDIMKTLKATRDQRIKQVENNRGSFLGVLKMLASRESRGREGRVAELMRLAGEKAYRDLGQPHEYMDGQVDRPILSADTLSDT